VADIIRIDACDGGIKERFADQGDGTFARVESATLRTSVGAGGVALAARLLSAAANTNPTLVKASAGRVYKIQGYNAAAAVRYLKLYNKATAPSVGTDTPVITLALQPSAAFALDFANIGFYFATGIGFGLTVASADNDTTALTAGDIVGMNVFYA